MSWSDSPRSIAWWNVSRVTPGRSPFRMREPGSFCTTYHASLFRCAPGCASAYSFGGCTWTERSSFASRNLIRIGNCPCPASGTSPVSDFPNSPTTQCSDRPVSGPLATSALIQSLESSTTPGGKSYSSQLSPIGFPGGSGLPSTVSIFRPPHIFSTKRGLNFRGYSDIEDGPWYVVRGLAVSGQPWWSRIPYGSP